MARKKKPKQEIVVPSQSSTPAIPTELLKDLRSMIRRAQERVAQAVNTGLALLYWEIGQRVHRDILKEKRADYGEQIVPTVSAQLTAEFGRGFAPRNLFRMIRFAEVFPDGQIVSTLSAQLGWSHFVEIIALDDELKRQFYAEMCRVERWSVRTLRAKIGAMLFERTAVSKKPDDLIQRDLQALHEEDKLSPDLVFRDPYFLDFLGLTGAYSEKDVEQAILRELEQFLLEFGTDFAFLARQKRITVDNEDYYLDLLFYHRRLRCLVAIELKLEKFRAADKGQLELYLRWLEEHETQPGEEPPIGLILCAGKTEEHVELLQLGASGIRVAEYMTELPSRKLLEQKLHDAIRLARERLAKQEAANDEKQLEKKPRNRRRQS